MGVPRKVVWNEQLEGVLLKALKEGKSAKQAAELIPGCSRSAAIGKARRLGESFGSGSPSTGRSTVAQTFKAPSPPRRIEPRPRPDPAVAAAAQKVAEAARQRALARALAMETAQTGTTSAAEAVVALSLRQCRWPIGDPSRPGFRFCCARTLRTYCDDHARIASSPKQPSHRDDDRAARLLLKREARGPIYRQ